MANTDKELTVSGILHVGTEVKGQVDPDWKVTTDVCSIYLSNPRIVVDEQHPGLSDVTYDVEIDGFGGGYVYEKAARDGQKYAIGTSVFNFKPAPINGYISDTLFFSTPDGEVSLQVKFVSQEKAMEVKVVPTQMEISRHTFFNGNYGGKRYVWVKRCIFDQ